GKWLLQGLPQGGVGLTRHVRDGLAALPVDLVLLAAVLDRAGRDAHRDAVLGNVAAHHRVRADDAAAADPAALGDRHLGAQPGVRTDAHRRLHDALILDRHGDVAGDVVEVADVHPVGHQRGVTDLDVQVAVVRVLPAEHRFVADAQRTLVAADGVAVADVHPLADLQPPVAGPAVQLDVLAEEHHAAQHHVRVG